MSHAGGQDTQRRHFFGLDQQRRLLLDLLLQIPVHILQLGIDRFELLRKDFPFPLGIPGMGQGIGELPDFFGVKRFAQIKDIVALGDIDDVTGPVLAEGGNDDNLDVRVQRPDPSGRLGPVDPRHVHVDERHRKRLAPCQRITHRVNALLAIFRQGQLIGLRGAGRKIRHFLSKKRRSFFGNARCLGLSQNFHEGIAHPRIVVDNYDSKIIIIHDVLRFH